jgi:hypothetical protein
MTSLETNLTGSILKAQIKLHVIKLLKEVETPISTNALFRSSGLVFTEREIVLGNQAYWFQAILDELENDEIIDDLRTGETGAHQYILREE